MKGSLFKFLSAVLVTANLCFAGDTILLKREFRRGDGYYLAPGLYDAEFTAPNGDVVVRQSDGQYVIPAKYYVEAVEEANGVKRFGYVILYRKISTRDDGDFVIFPGLRRVFGVGADGTLALSDPADRRPIRYIAGVRDYVPTVAEFNRVMRDDFVLINKKVNINHGHLGFHLNPGSWPIVALGRNGDVILRDPTDSKVVDYIVSKNNYQPLYAKLAESEPEVLLGRFFVYSAGSFWRKSVPIPVVPIRSEGKDIGVVRASDFLDVLGHRNSLIVYKIADPKVFRTDSIDEYKRLLEQDSKSRTAMPGPELQQVFIPPDLSKNPDSVLNFVNSRFGTDSACLSKFRATSP